MRLKEITKQEFKDRLKNPDRAHIVNQFKKFMEIANNTKHVLTSTYRMDKIETTIPRDCMHTVEVSIEYNDVNSTVAILDKEFLALFQVGEYEQS